MPYKNFPATVDQNVQRTRRAAAILTAFAAVVWGAAAMLNSQDTATADVDSSAPAITVGSVAPSATLPTQLPKADESGDPTEPDDPSDPQVPVGGNGDLAPTPTTEPPSCDGQCVAPVDLHPFEVEVGRLPTGIGLANAVTGGCSTDCITRAQIFQSDDTTNIEIEVETNTPAFIAIYVDNEAPHVTDDGRPYFPGAQPVVNTHGDLDTWFADTLADLNEQTEYWIIVRATDTDVRSSYVVGSLVTPYLGNDVVIAFAAIDIIYDGDHGRNKGELSFAWYTDLDEVGRNGQYERGDGSRIDLSHLDNVAGVFAMSDGAGPTLQMRGVERDPAPYCTMGDINPGYGTNDDCGIAWNSTVPFTPTLDDIAMMADCSAFDLGDLYDGWVCTRIATSESHSGIPEFSVVVAFKVS
ncbi:MAG: hypothetical protein ABL953_05140 [Ilumatobacteraceae bacterium]